MINKEEDRGLIGSLAGTIYAQTPAYLKRTPESAVEAAIQIMAAVDARLKPPEPEKHGKQSR
jgi:hypothetical protein